jgi:hypothetical protein
MSSPAQAPEPWPRSDQQPFDLQLLSPEPGSTPLRGPCLCFAAAAASPVAKGMQLAAAARLDQVDSPLRGADSPGKVWPLSPAALHRQYSRAPRQFVRSVFVTLGPLRGPANPMRAQGPKPCPSNET